MSDQESYQEFAMDDVVSATKGDYRIDGTIEGRGSFQIIVVKAIGPDGYEARWNHSLQTLREGKYEIKLVKKANHLPKEPGLYESESFPLKDGFTAYCLKKNGLWYLHGDTMAIDNVENLLPLKRLMAVSDTLETVRSKMVGIIAPAAGRAILNDASEALGVKLH